MITDRAYKRMSDKVSNGAAPHMLIDGVALAQNRMDLGTDKNGQLHIISGKCSS